MYDANDSNQGELPVSVHPSTNNHKDVQTIDSKAVFFHATYNFNTMCSA
jgi:hypothetical protein